MSFNAKQKLVVNRLPYTLIFGRVRQKSPSFNSSGDVIPGLNDQVPNPSGGTMVNPNNYHTFVNNTGFTIKYRLDHVFNVIIYSGAATGAITNPYVNGDKVHIEYLNFATTNLILSSPGIVPSTTVYNGVSGFNKGDFETGGFSKGHTAIYFTTSIECELKPGEFHCTEFNQKVRAFSYNNSTSTGSPRTIYEQAFLKETISYLE